jgi:hypothetical protein
MKRLTLTLIFLLGCKPIDDSKTSSDRVFVNAIDLASVEAEFTRLVNGLSHEEELKQENFLEAVFASQKRHLGQGSIALLSNTAGRCIVVLAPEAERFENSETVEWVNDISAIGYSRDSRLPSTECQSFFERELGSTEGAMFSFYNYKFQ